MAEVTVCPICERNVRRNQSAVECNYCYSWVHKGFAQAFQIVNLIKFASVSRKPRQIFGNAKIVYQMRLGEFHQVQIVSTPPVTGQIISPVSYKPIIRRLWN